MELKPFVPPKLGLTKTLRIVKLTAVILLSFCLQVSAKTWGQTITLNVKDQPIEKVFAEIERQTGYTFTYGQGLLDKVKTVSVNVKNATINETLDQCFRGKPFTYKIVDKIISIDITPPKYSEPIQKINSDLIDIHGKVVNEKGEPVEGVSVTIKGTKISTSTNLNGEFSLSSITKEASLVFTSVNMETFELKLNGRTELTISLKTKISALGGVSVTVNTGYQQINKERMVGSYSQLDSAAYSRRTGMGIIDRLDGTVPGVLFDKKTPAGVGAPIQIRGISTLLNPILSPSPNPLIIVDNFPFAGDLSLINSYDVENITVLKDAAAASIWGTLAGNGVIVITTKKGKYNQPFRISFSSNMTLQDKPDLYYAPQMSSTDFINVEKYLFSNGFYDANLTDPTYPVVSPVVEILNKLRSGTITQAQSDAQINIYKGLDLRNDLNKYVYQKALTQQYYINLGGGNNMMSYQLSAGYNHAMPNIIGSKSDDQYTINSNTVFRPLKNLEVYSGISFSQGTTKSYNFSLPNLYPYAQLADAQGNSLPIPTGLRIGYIDTVGGGQLLDWHNRPLDEIRAADNNSMTRFIRLNFGVSYRVNKLMSAEIKYQYSNQSSVNRNLYNQKTYFTRNLINLYTNLTETNPDLRYPVPLGGILDLYNLETSSHNIREQLNFNKNWGSKHVLTALMASEISETKNNSNSSRFYGYDDGIGTYKTNIDYLDYFPLYGDPYGASNTIPQNNNYSTGNFNRFVSLLANASYTYNNIYTVYASGRRDGANVFGVNTNNKWKPLWSAGASWDISKERFYSLHWLPSLRLRTSYGYMGNVNNNLSGLPIIYYGNPALYTSLPEAQVFNAPNPDLKWEQIRTVNLGLDFGMFKNRFTGSLELFNKKSTDLISLAPFAPASGISQYAVNYASLKGNGFELQLNSKNTIRALKWETSFGLSYVKMIVAKLYKGGFKASDFIAYNINASVGKVAYGISSYRWAGLDPTTGDPQGYLNGQVSKNYTGIFNDSIQNQVFNGSTIPLYSGYIGNSITWKNITLSANITYRLAYYFRRPSINYTSLFNNWIGHPDYSLRWQKPGDEKVTNVPSMIYPGNSDRDAFYAGSEINILRADNIRLQDIRLQYYLENTAFKIIPVKSVQVFVYAIT